MVHFSQDKDMLQLIESGVHVSKTSNKKLILLYCVLNYHFTYSLTYSLMLINLYACLCVRLVRPSGAAIYFKKSSGDAPEGSRDGGRRQCVQQIWGSSSLYVRSASPHGRCCGE